MDPDLQKVKTGALLVVPPECLETLVQIQLSVILTRAFWFFLVPFFLAA
jgi:hypothetical protein